jgi:hypothetical protein
MIGLPTETREDMLATLELNARCRTDVVKVMTFIRSRAPSCTAPAASSACCPTSSPPAPRCTGPPCSSSRRTCGSSREKALEYPDCYLNALTEGLEEKHYRPLVNELESMPREQWERPEVRASFEQRRNALSADLLARQVDHYAIRFSHFAVRLCGGRDVAKA